MFDEVVLGEASFQSAVLLVAPFSITAACFPVGNVARGGCDPVFGEGFGDSGMGDVVAEHAVDHVANGIGEAGDFAVATDFAGRARGWIIGLVDYWILDGDWFEASCVFRVACSVILRRGRHA